jgi:hypothetical protein
VTFTIQAKIRCKTFVVATAQFVDNSLRNDNAASPFDSKNQHTASNAAQWLTARSARVKVWSDLEWLSCANYVLILLAFVTQCCVAPYWWNASISS